MKADVSRVLRLFQWTCSSPPLVTPLNEPLLQKSIEEIPHKLLGLGLVAISAVCFSIVSTLVKYESRRGLSTFELVFWRSSIALALNMVALKRQLLKVDINRSDWTMMLLQSLSGFGSVAFAFSAMSHMVLADASVIVFTSPILTFFFGAMILNERVDLFCLACASISIVGIMCVVRPPFLFDRIEHHHVEQYNSTFGIICAVTAAVAQAVLYISLRKLQHINSFVIAHYFALCCTSISFIFLLLVNQDFQVPSSFSQALAVIAMGVVAFIGQVCLTRGFQLESAGMAAVMRYLDVVCVFLWDSLFLREQISLWSVVGAVIICVSTAMITYHKTQIMRNINTLE